jgi:hypothetical protein
MLVSNCSDSDSNSSSDSLLDCWSSACLFVCLSLFLVKLQIPLASHRLLCSRNSLRSVSNQASSTRAIKCGPRTSLISCVLMIRDDSMVLLHWRACNAETDMKLETKRKNRALQSPQLDTTRFVAYITNHGDHLYVYVYVYVYVHVWRAHSHTCPWLKHYFTLSHGSYWSKKIYIYMLYFDSDPKEINLMNRKNTICYSPINYSLLPPTNKQE